MIYFNNDKLINNIPEKINVIKLSENSFKYCIKPENYTPEILSWVHENIENVKIQVEKLNYVPIKRDKFIFTCTTLPAYYINGDAYIHDDLCISKIIAEYERCTYHYYKVRILKLTPVVKSFLEDLLKTYVKKNMNLYEIFGKIPYDPSNWCYNYGDVITRDEILELLKLFDDEKPKETIKVEEKFDSYDQILEDNKKLAQKCKNLMDENKKLKQIIQQLQCKIATDSSSYYSDSSE
jgi:hypothetical protein